MEGASEFTNLHFDAIREMGNIGTGNAATALSRLIGRVVEMDVPVAELVPIYEITSHYGSPEMPVCAILVRTDAEFSCTLIFMIAEDKAPTMADLIIPMDISEMDEESRDMMRDSALSEQGNIILGAFLNAMATITGWVLPTTTPAVAHDMLGSIMDLVASLFGVIGDAAMLVKTSLKVTGLEDGLDGTVIMIPDPGSLEKLLAKLGVL